jgi:hypothetical protein
MEYSPKQLKRIRDALYGVSINEDLLDFEEPYTSDRIDDPPSYIVKLAFEVVYGGELPMGGDKSEWELTFDFEGVKWCCYDWKHYAWSLVSDKDDPVLEDKLIGKIRSASRIIDCAIKDEAIKLRDEGKFSLANDYAGIHGAYEYFRAQVETKINLIDSMNSGARTGKRTAIDIFRLRREMQYNIYACSVFFFALTEIYLASCFALKETLPMSYIDFSRLDWKERYKLIICEKFYNDDSSLYDHLLDIRRYYRNIPAHASPLYLFSHPDVGLIPATFGEFASQSVTIGRGPFFSKTEAERILGVFGKAIELFTVMSCLKRGAYYASSGLPIHLHGEQRDELIAIKTYDEFCHIVDIYVDREYAYLNGEI